MTIDPQRLQVVLDVLARAPVTRAEQLIVQGVIDQLIAQVSQGVAAPQAPLESAPLTNGAAEHPLPRQYQPE